MQWFILATFPLHENLAPLHKILLAKSVPHRFTEEAGELRLWICGEEHLPLVKDALVEFEQGQHAHTFTHSQPPVSLGWFQAILDQWNRTPLTLIWIVLGGVGFLFQSLGLYAITNQLKFSPFSSMVEQSSYWKLITPAFIHFGWVHFIFNTLWIWLFGEKLERLLGFSKFCLLFIATAIGANVLQYLLGGATNFGGLSGVVYGFAGCLMLLSRKVAIPGRPIPNGIFIFMLVMLGMGFTGAMDLFVDGSIANWAHLGGLLSGLLFGWLYCVLRVK